VRIVKAWDRFWFEPRETLTLGVIRALAGFLVLSYALLISGYVQTWFTNSGLVSSQTAQAYDGPYHFSLLLIWPSATAVWIVFGLLIVFSISMMLGFFSRLSCILVYICLLSFDHRDLIILNSGDTMLKLLTFYLCLSPCEASFSLDAVIRRRQRRERPNLVSALLNNLTYGASGPVAAPWALRLIQIQVSVVYISTVLSKLPGPMWQNGSALWNVYNLSEMMRFPLPSLFHSPFMINAASWGTLLIEFSMAVLVWFPGTRLFALLLGALLHLGIEYSMNVPLFSAIMLTAYLSFLDLSILWRRFLSTPWAHKLKLAAASESSKAPGEPLEGREAPVPRQRSRSGRRR